MKEKKRFFLFAGDQKIEHLNKDFYGKNIPEECADPEHMFKIASKAKISAFATQLGLIRHYGASYKDVNYVVKLNSKTDIVPTEQKDPLSLALHSVEDVLDFKKRSRLSIIGIGYTIYLGSEFEAQMLTEAAQVVFNANKNGLLSILWVYPRGKAVKDDRDPDIIAGAAGVAAALGADFVKINPPSGEPASGGPKQLKQAVMAAGKTGVLCSGGKKRDKEEFLKELEEQAAVGVAGCAVGRNIHQRSEKEALELCDDIASVLGL